MNAEQLIKEFGEKIGLPTLSLDSDQQSAITVGERQIDMCGPPSGMFFLSTVAGTLPVQDRAHFLNKLLMKNMEVINESYAFGVDPATSEVLLLLRAHISVLDATKLQQMVETIIEMADSPDILMFEDDEE